MLTTSHQYAGQNRVGLCSSFGPIASIRFPDDHPWPQLSLSQVIGGIQAIHMQEAQQMRAMFTQSTGKADIIRVFQLALPGNQGVELCFQGLGTLGEGGRIQVGFLCFQHQSGSGAAYTVTVNTGSGSGSLRLDVSDNDSIIDTTGNPLGGPGPGNGNFTTGEAYMVNKTYRIYLPLVIR